MMNQLSWTGELFLQATSPYIYILTDIGRVVGQIMSRLHLISDKVMAGPVDMDVDCVSQYIQSVSGGVFSLSGSWNVLIFTRFSVQQGPATDNFFHTP